jgi:hypothetical protein
MVTLRIWYPSRFNKFSAGSSSITIDGVRGAAYASTRPVGKEKLEARMFRTATLDDDIEAEGTDTQAVWLFRNLDEGRMLRLWSAMMGTVVNDADLYSPDTSFRTSDMLLAAGRGIAVDDATGTSYTQRAQGDTVMVNLAASCGALSIRADRYLKFEHW